MSAQGLYNLITTRRTIRLFSQRKVPLALIRKVINAARLAPSAANLQFLEYVVVDDEALKKEVFSQLKFGGYVWPKRVPSPAQRPAFYIIITINRTKTKKPDLRDVGAAAENMLLALRAFALGGCWVASVNKRALGRMVRLPEHYTIDSVIAAGYPKERPVLEERSFVKYWLDKNNRLHVPKRPLKTIFHRNRLIG